MTNSNKSLKLNYPVGELGVWPSGEMNQNKTKSIQDNQEKQIERVMQDFKKAEPVVKTRKVQILK